MNGGYRAGEPYAPHATNSAHQALTHVLFPRATIETGRRRVRVGSNAVTSFPGHFTNPATRIVCPTHPVHGRDNKKNVFRVLSLQSSADDWSEGRNLTVVLSMSASPSQVHICINYAESELQNRGTTTILYSIPYTRQQSSL